jgi:hypothetical protein
LSSFKRVWLVALAVLAVLTLGLAACDDDEGDANTEESAAMQEDISRVSVTAAMTAYRTEGLHDLDDEATTASEIGAGWSGSIERMHAVTVGTLWPDDLEEMATTLEDELKMAEDAIDADDLEGSKEHIALAHAAWHDLEPQAYAYIAGEEGEDGGHESEEASPGATGDAGGTADDHSEESPEASPGS